MPDLDALADQAARRATMAPKGLKTRWQRIAQTIRTAALTHDQARQRAILKALEA